ncbi:MAG: trehalose-6-phosphate synthase [Chlamydiales bacterium]|nr:trehalose-6-phosphate synthase [Chlamydiales bacterium]
MTFHQVVVPSRSQISEYSDLKSEIDALVGEINSAYTRPGWVPIHYSYRSLSREELVAFYRSADVMLITPVKDGMNLVAKEFVAANIEESGVLVLSEFAGAAAQLGSQALLINPYHTVGVAEAVYRALMMPKEEKQQRMKILRDLVRKEDIFAWIDSIISVAHQNKIVT